MAGIALTSQVATAFGATIEVPADQPGLFFLIARTGDPAPLVTRAAGRLVARLGPHRVLALLTHDSAADLGRHPAIRLCGPVSIDPKRFEVFASMAGLDTPR